MQTDKYNKHVEVCPDHIHMLLEILAPISVSAFGEDAIVSSIMYF